jgi:[ribosomal protein S5]-alanine N-acetyltransferase
VQDPAFTLETERLVLTPLDDNDVASLVRHWGDAEVRRYLWDDKPVTDDMVSDVVTTSNRDFRERRYGIWAVRFLHQRDLLGMCGLREVRGGSAIEILYSLRPRYWRQGLATEAARAVLMYAFEELGITEIVAYFDDGNVASAGVLRRLGMSEVVNVLGDSPLAGHWYTTRDRFRNWTVPVASVFPPAGELA